MAVNYAITNTANQYIQGGLEITTSTNGGNVTVTAKLYVRRTNAYSSATTDSSVAKSITIDGSTTSATAALNLAGGQQNTWQGPVLTATKTFTGSARNINVSWSMKGSYTTNFNGSGSATFAVPAGYVAPSGGYITITGKTYNSVTAKVGVSSFGIPAANKELDFKVLEAAYTEERATRQNNYLANGATTTVNNNSATSGGGITIVGNKLYHTGLYASNCALNYKFQGPTFTTPCPPLSALSFKSHSYKTYNTENAVVAWTRQSDGGALARTLRYRYSTDNGKTYSGWASAGAATAGSGTFTISGLPTAKTVIVQAKLTTSAGDSKTKSLTFTTLATHTAPNFSNFAYTDTNAAVTALTGSDQTFIQGQSVPVVKVPAANKATGNQSIAISSYNITFSGSSYSMGYSSSAEVSKTLNKPSQSGTLALRVSAVDALSLSKAVDKNITVYPWAKPVISANITRQGGFESSCTLTIKGSYSPISVGGTVKNTLAVAWRYKKSSSTDWSEWESRPVTVNGSNWTTENLAKTLDNNSQWDIQIRAVDKFETVVASLVLSVGMPKFFIGKDGRVAVGKRPEYSTNGMSGSLEVAGRVYAAGDVFSGGTSDKKRLVRVEELARTPKYAENMAVSNDTPAGWSAALGGTGRYWIWYTQAGKFASQPAQYGFLEVFVNGSSEVSQIWHTQAGAAMYIRAGNASGFSSGWRRVAELNTVYPVGSVYISATLDTAAKVASALGGGTWVQTSTGRALVGFDSSQSEFNSVLKTGGAKTHTLTTAQLPSHNHGLTGYIVPNGATNGWTVKMSFGGSEYAGVEYNVKYSGSSAKWVNATSNSGSGGAHNNLQPYMTFYMWRRTA